jgi:hypothetical protein
MKVPIATRRELLLVTTAAAEPGPVGMTCRPRVMTDAAIETPDN